MSAYSQPSITNLSLSLSRVCVCVVDVAEWNSFWSYATLGSSVLALCVLDQTVHNFSLVCLLPLGGGRGRGKGGGGGLCDCSYHPLHSLLRLTKLISIQKISPQPVARMYAICGGSVLNVQAAFDTHFVVFWPSNNGCSLCYGCQGSLQDIWGRWIWRS